MSASHRVIRPRPESPWSRVRIFTVSLSPPISLRHITPPLTVHMAVDEYSAEAFGDLSRDTRTPRTVLNGELDLFNNLARTLPYKIRELDIGNDFDMAEFEEASRQTGIAVYCSRLSARAMIARQRLDAWYDTCADLGASIFDDIDINLVLKRVHNDVAIQMLDGNTPTQTRRLFFDGIDLTTRLKAA